MSGTKEGGLKASTTNKARHGEDFYNRIGSVGGKNGTTGGFFNNPELARQRQGQVVRKMLKQK